MAAAVGGLLFGYDTAVISGAILFVRESFRLDPFQTEVAVASVLAGCALGAGAAGYFADKFGRRPILIVDAVAFGVFAVLTARANTFGSFVLARLLTGLSVGMASMITPLYIAEIAPSRIRGSLVTLNQLAIVVGVVAAYGSDYYFSAHGNWRAMFLSAVAPSLVLFIAFIFLPESPRWLATHKSTDEAYQVLCRVGGRPEAQKYLTELGQLTETAQVRFRDLFAPRFRNALVIGIGLGIFQQITGVNAITYYAPTVLQMAGFHSASSAILATLLVGGVNLAFTVLSLFLLDRSGRRPLLLWGIALMTISLVILGYFFGARHVPQDLILASVLTYIASFAIGLGPIFWLLISEIYPTAVRGQAMSLATVTIWVFDLVVTVTFLSLVGFLGVRLTFWFYAVAGTAAFFFSFYKVPETKGRTLEEIEALWA